MFLCPDNKPYVGDTERLLCLKSYIRQSELSKPLPPTEIMQSTTLKKATQT